MKEIWKDIKELEGRYQISNYGRVRSLRFHNNQVDKPRKEPKILKPNNNGHYDFFVFHTRSDKRKRMYVHRMVAEHFIENPNNYPVVNHKDCNCRNNRSDNLEWCTTRHNVLWSIIVGGKTKKRRYENAKNNDYYICKRTFRSTVVYEVTVNKKYLGHYRTVEEARSVRDAYMGEIGWTAY